MKITAASLTPSWFTGVEVTDVSITTEPNEPPFKLERATARVSLLALLTGKIGITASAPIAQGNVSATVEVSDDIVDVEADLDGIQLELLPILTEASGIPFVGTATLEADLVIGKKDPKLTNGSITLKAKGLAIGKGAKLGPLPLPPLEFGDIDLKIPLEERMDRAGLGGRHRPCLRRSRPRRRPRAR